MRPFGYSVYEVYLANFVGSGRCDGRHLKTPKAQSIYSASWETKQGVPLVKRKDGKGITYRPATCLNQKKNRKIYHRTNIGSNM